MFDEIRDVGADATVGERRILFRDSRSDVIPLSLGKAQCEPVDELPGIRTRTRTRIRIRRQWGHAASLRRAALLVNAR